MEFIDTKFNYNEPGKEIMECLYRACHHMDWATERWQSRRATGLDDEGLREALSFEFGSGYGVGGSELAPMYCQGGVEPRFWCGAHLGRSKITLRGKVLINAVRELLKIPHPKPASIVDQVMDEVWVYEEKAVTAVSSH